MKRFGYGLVAVSALGTCLALGGVARANLATSFVSATDSVGGGSDWTYAVTVDTIQQVNNAAFANFITIYDFGASSMLSITANPAFPSFGTWVGSANLTNTPANLVTPADDPNILNFRLTAFPVQLIDGPALLGTFTIHSPFGTTAKVVSDDGQAEQLTNPTGIHGNIGTTLAPVPGPIVGGGLSGLVAACGGLLALARRRRQKVAS